MTDVSITHILRPTQVGEEILGRLKTSLSTSIRRISARRRLLIDLETLPDGALQDIGLLQDDVSSLRRASLFGDGPGQMAERLRKRRATCDPEQT